ncbi:MFS transporter [Arthrobacter sp. Br18]|uniref:MFS transporter n=1 Tax=Arthrobacter sp. Br18 TaxID=1312954 RepID=UPI0004BB8751|nr:MFS transporter [Arthrobacter sp. Br18]
MAKDTQDLPRGGLAALCAAETTSWGLLYYSLPVAVIPIVQDTGWSAQAVTGAFSAGLLVSAVVGIWIGRLLDRRGPKIIMTSGSVLGAAALVLVALSPTLPVFVLAWLTAGCAQAAILYQPAFVVITRWYGAARVRALTTLTLVAGFASTIFSPLTALLIESLGWRPAFLVLAGILAVVTLPLHWFFLNATWAPGATTPSGTAGVRAITRSRRFVMLQIAMALTTLALFAVTLNLIPLLLERGFDYRTAALVFGLVGAGQVLGRVGYASLQGRTSPIRRTVILMGSGALCLALLGVLPGPAVVLVGVVVLTGMLRGCNTLLQATAVADRWGTGGFGALHGVFVAPITAMAALAPAAGPLLAGQLGSYSAMAVGMAVLAAAAMVAAARS